MRITVLGASGQVGQWVVREACDRDAEVRAVWRRAPEVDTGAAEIAVEPEILDVDALRRTCEDADAIVCAVGQRRRSPRNPWSRILSPTDLGRRLAETLDEALGARSPQLVFVSAAGVGDSWTRMSFVLRFVFGRSNIGVGYRDLADMEDTLRDSGRDCLVVRPTTLTNGSGTACRRVDRFRLWSRIPRRAVARYLVDRALRADIRGFHTEMISG